MRNLFNYIKPILMSFNLIHSPSKSDPDINI